VLYIRSALSVEKYSIIRTIKSREMSLLDHIACITGEKVMVKMALCLITCDITKSFQGVEKQLCTCIFVNTAVNGSKCQLHVLFALSLEEEAQSCPDTQWRREKCLLLPAIESIFLHYPANRTKLTELSLLLEI
jgi:hypothetical protein